jgi:hypothetical protein
LSGALSWSFDRWTVYRTIGKCPAFHLVSRFYRIGYNALLSPLPSLDPLSGQAFGFGFRLCPYLIVKVLLVSSFIVVQKALLNEQIN